MGKEGEGILVYYCIPQRDKVADVHAWPQADLRPRAAGLPGNGKQSCLPKTTSKSDM